MRIVDNQVAVKNMSEKSVQNWGAYIGEAPERLGLVATMYPENTLMNFVDSVLNVYSKSAKKGFEGSRSTIVEWNIDVDFIKKVFVSMDSIPPNQGVNGEIFSVTFREKYFDPRDVFYVGEGRQTYLVLSKAHRLATDKWVYQIQLITNNPLETIADSVFVKEAYAIYSHNIYSEWSERGYVKHQANMETHRNHMTFIRSSESWSMQYAAMEDFFIETATKEGKAYLTYKQKEKNAIDHFVNSRESQGMTGRTNFDVNGKCMMQDPEDGQDMPTGDGIIAQVEKHAEVFAIDVLTSEILEEALAAMRKRSGKMTGNKYVVMSNTILWDAFQRLMKSDLRWIAQDASYFYSKEKGGDVKVGATFSSYEFSGNTITFMPSKALSDRYENKAYGIILDAGIDQTTNKPNIAAYSLKGNEFIIGRENGMGGQDGKTSGIVSSGRTGSAFHVSGSAMYVVHNPYKSVLFEGNQVA